MRFLTDEERARLTPSELLPHRTPIPTQMVSSDECLPFPQTEKQRELEARLLDLGGRLARRQGISRRRFFQTAAGMAAAYVALNETFGGLFDVSRAEAATPGMADERAASLRDQFIMDMHTHFLRDDTRLTQFVAMRQAVGKAGWNRQLADKEQTLDDLKFENYVKEIYLDSDTKIALISSSPSDIAQDWFLTNQQMADARAAVNQRFGSRRLFTHAIFTPGQPGWLENVDAALELKPESMKGYTVGDNTHKATSRYPWRMDDEAVTYKAYEKFVKAGVKNVCVHKGLFAPALEEQFPKLASFADASDVGKAAKDWPQLNFIIYHGAYRHVGGDVKVALAEFERTGRIAWTSDLADIPEKYGVGNVYADVGQLFATTLIAEPRVTAALLGMMIKRMGRQGGLGHRRGMERITAVADRGTASPGNSGRHAAGARLRAVGPRRRSGQAGAVRGQQCPSLRHRSGTGLAATASRRALAAESGIRAQRSRPQQPALRVRGAVRT